MPHVSSRTDYTAGGLKTKASAAMPSINIAVINPWFMMTFLETAAACVLVAVSSLSTWQTPGTTYLLVGCLFYLVGAIGVTIAFNDRATTR
jgi:uncharacterized membrane protein